MSVRNATEMLAFFFFAEFEERVIPCSDITEGTPFLIPCVNYWNVVAIC
jgi:hypothetical protein